MVLVDAFSKWIDVFELGQSVTTVRTINHLLRFISIFDLSSVLVTDNGLQFMSNEFRELCLQNGIEHKRTPSYHPASNGQCECIVQELKKAPCIKASWTVHLSRVFLSFFFCLITTTPHTTICQSLASLLLKKQPTLR